MAFRQNRHRYTGNRVDMHSQEKQHFPVRFPPCLQRSSSTWWSNLGRAVTHNKQSYNRNWYHSVVGIHKIQPVNCVINSYWVSQGSRPAATLKQCFSLSFIFVFFVHSFFSIVAVYLLVGVSFNAVTTKSLQAPNAVFWTTLPGLIKVNTFFDKITSC